MDTHTGEAETREADGFSSSSLKFEAGRVSTEYKCRYLKKNLFKIKVVLKLLRSSHKVHLVKYIKNSIRLD